MTRQIAYNSNTRKWEVVEAEDETTGSWNVITQYWCKSLNAWVTIPQE